MSVSKLIEDQLAVFRTVEKRFDERINANNFQARLTAATDDQIKRIQSRIGRLEKEKASALARYDAAIADEKKALEDVKARAKTVVDTTKQQAATTKAKPAEAREAKAASPKKQAPARKTVKAPPTTAATASRSPRRKK